MFSPAGILVPLRARSDDDALRQLVERLVASAGVKEPDRIMQHLTEEAALRATLVGHGAGIVHTRLDALEAPVAALGILAPGESLHLGAGLQFIVDVIFLVLSPVAPPEPHLDLVASIDCRSGARPGAAEPIASRWRCARCHGVAGHHLGACRIATGS